MSQSPQDPLQPVLRDAEAELRRRLREACEAEARGVHNESAAEIRQLEDMLLAAAVAAENTLTLRRHIKGYDLARRKPGDATISEIASPPKPPRDVSTAPNAQSKGDPATSLREFKDSAGQAWRAWTITPGLARAGRTANFLGEFQHGWVCFENPAAGGRRRLPGHPERWSELSEPELEGLLQQAITVRERRVARREPRQES